jgi:cysteine desulfuration protein SufE
MKTLDQFLAQPHHADLVQEYFALETAEDKLTWLMERPALHPEIPLAARTIEARVPGCLSGLWLQSHSTDSLYHFTCASESEVVQGIGSLLCDLYSGRSREEILTIGPTFATALKLDGLLTITRRRAVSSIISFILHGVSRGDVQPDGTHQRAA